MKTFLLKGKRPIIKWGMIPDEIYFQGEIPKGFSLAVCPSKGTVVIDVDRHGVKDGFKAIPVELLKELEDTLSYPTKNNGRHYWLHYTGKETLGNKTSGQGIDLRTEKGYVVWYPKEENLHKCMELVKESSQEMNQWLEELFCFKHK